MAAERAHFEAAGVDATTLDSMAALGIDWGTILKIILEILQGFGVPAGAGTTVAQAKSLAASYSINWGNILQIVLNILKIFGGLAGGAPTQAT